LLGRLSDRNPASKAAEGCDPVQKASPSNSQKEEHEAAEQAVEEVQLPHALPIANASLDDEVAARELSALKQAVEEELPPGPRICVLGSKAFDDPDSEPLVCALAERLASYLRGSNAVVLTGGNPGIQATFVRCLKHGGFDRIVNLLHIGQQSRSLGGEDLVAGMDSDERDAVFGSLGDVYLCIEGGPAAAREALLAVENGAFVLPMPSTGGASSGSFGFPASALQQPRFATEAEWAFLTEKAEPDVAAAAAVKIIGRAISYKTATAFGLSSPGVSRQADRTLPSCLTACW